MQEKGESPPVSTMAAEGSRLRAILEIGEALRSLVLANDTTPVGVVFFQIGNDLTLSDPDTPRVEGDGGRYQSVVDAFMKDHLFRDKRDKIPRPEFLQYFNAAEKEAFKKIGVVPSWDNLKEKGFTLLKKDERLEVAYQRFGRLLEKLKPVPRRPAVRDPPNNSVSNPLIATREYDAFNKKKREGTLPGISTEVYQEFIDEWMKKHLLSDTASIRLRDFYNLLGRAERWFLKAQRRAMPGLEGMADDDAVTYLSGNIGFERRKDLMKQRYLDETELRKMPDKLKSEKWHLYRREMKT